MIDFTNILEILLPVFATSTIGFFIWIVKSMFGVSSAIEKLNLKVDSNQLLEAKENEQIKIEVKRVKVDLLELQQDHEKTKKRLTILERG